MTTTTQGELGPIGQISRTVRDIKQAEAVWNVLGLRHLLRSATSRSSIAAARGYF